MAKQAGLGDNAYISGYDLSGNIMVLNNIRGGPAALDLTAINQLGKDMEGGIRDGEFTFTTAMDPAALKEHALLSQLLLTDQICTYFNGQAIGAPAATVVAKQVNYDPTRDAAGNLPFSCQCLANGFGLNWGVELTPGIRTDATATAASAANSLDTGGSLSFGAQAYLHVFAVVGTSVTVAIWDSADNVTFTAVATLAFSAVAPGGAPQAQRIVIGNTATVRRYVAVATTGTFTSAQIAVQLSKNTQAGQVF